VFEVLGAVSYLRVETLSFEEAADFNPQEWFILFMIITGRYGCPRFLRHPQRRSPHGGQAGVGSDLLKLVVV
jgi:hypothetical protein